MKFLKFTIAVFCLCNIVAISYSLDKDSVVGMWLFDDGKGDVAKDSSGNGNDGKLISSPKWVNDGKIGGALEFEFAKANNVRAPLPHSNTVTVALWAKYKTLPTANIGLIHVQAGEIVNGGPGTKTIGMWVENSTQLWGRVIPDGGGNTNFPKNESLKADTWYHIAMVIDPTAKKARQYVNAKEVGVVDYPGKLTKYDFINIGRQGSETWDGVIDEVIFLNEALSVDDLKKLSDGIEAALSVEPIHKLATTWGEIKAAQ